MPGDVRTHTVAPSGDNNVNPVLSGLEFDWFAVDHDGNLALFATAGEGFVPAPVAEHHGLHSDLSDSLTAPHHGTADVWSDYAAVGLFIFDWRLPGGPYEKRASPSHRPGSALIERVETLPLVPRYAGSFDTVTTVADWP
jgi:hypothetical protein